jgi:hypothetical protein
MLVQRQQMSVDDRLPGWDVLDEYQVAAAAAAAAAAARNAR